MKTETMMIKGDKYTLNQMAAEPHGFRIYRKLHKHLGPLLEAMERDDRGIASAVASIVESDEFTSDLETMLEIGNLTCNGAEVAKLSSHLGEKGYVRLYQIVMLAIKVNFQEVFTDLVGGLQRLANNQEDGASGSLQGSILSALGLSRIVGSSSGS